MRRGIACRRDVILAASGNSLNVIQRVKIVSTLTRKSMGAFRCLSMVGELLAVVHASGHLVCYSVHRLLAG